MEQTTRKSVLDVFIWFFLGILLYFAIQKLFFILFPICLSFALAQGIRSSFRRLKPLSEGVKKILVVLILMIFFAFLSLLVILLTDRLIHAVSSLSSTLTESAEAFLRTFQGWIGSAEDFFSRLLNRNLENRFQSSLPIFFGKAMEQIAAKIPSWIASLVAFVPRFFVSFFIFLICTYYFSCDWERFSRFLRKRISEKRLTGLYRFKRKFFFGLKRYTRAYFYLFLFTFSILFFGLVLMRVSGAASKAFFIAVVDLLPVFGCGTVLIPWAIIAFISGKTALGLSLLILYAVQFILRQIIEPKIVGSSIGLHPVLSLLLVLGGLYLFGFFGMVLLPLSAACLLQEENEI